MADRPQPHQLQVHPQYGKGGFPQRGVGVGAGEYGQGPSAGKIMAVLTLLPLGGTLLFLAGLTFVGTLIGLAVSAPVFLIFSPVLVPAAVTIALAVTGFLTSGAFGVTGMSSLSWVFKYLRLDQAKRSAEEMAMYAGQKAKDVGQDVQSKAQEGKQRT